MALVTAAVVAIGAHTVATAPLGSDYPGSLPKFNHAGGAIRALVDGDLDAFFERQPPMGSFSLVLRAPFAALAKLDGELPPYNPRFTTGRSFVVLTVDRPTIDAEIRLYRLGIIPCIAVLGLAALLAGRRLAEAGRPLLLQLGVVALFMLNPLIDSAMILGHPEELLAAGLVILSWLAASAGRPAAAGIALGLAIATKQWALLAAIPVIAAAAPSWRHAAAAALAAVALFTVPMAVGDPDRYFTSAPSLARGDSLVQPYNLWWPISRHDSIFVFDGVEDREIPRYTLPPWLERLVHPFAALVGLAVAAGYVLRRRAPDAGELLLLITLVFLLRNLLDHLTHPYYHLPFLVALACWETLYRRTLPLLTIAVTTFMLPSVRLAPDDWDLVNALYLAWALPLAVLLALRLFAPARAERILSPG